MSTENTSTEDRVRQIMGERLFIDAAPQALSRSEALEDLGVDSVLMLELVAAIEEEFGIRIGEDEITRGNFGNLEAVLGVIRTKTTG